MISRILPKSFSFSCLYTELTSTPQGTNRSSASSIFSARNLPLPEDRVFAGTCSFKSCQSKQLPVAVTIIKKDPVCPTVLGLRQRFRIPDFKGFPYLGFRCQYPKFPDVFFGSPPREAVRSQSVLLLYKKATSSMGTLTKTPTAGILWLSFSPQPLQSFLCPHNGDWGG